MSHSVCFVWSENGYIFGFVMFSELYFVYLFWFKLKEYRRLNFNGLMSPKEMIMATTFSGIIIQKDSNRRWRIRQWDIMNVNSPSMHINLYIV